MTNATPTTIEQIISNLKGQLKWRNDYQKSATDGDYMLVQTVGDNDSKFTLYDENNNEVESWKE